MTQSPLPDLRVALFPLNIKWGDKEANIQAVEAKAQALAGSTDILILPETFSTGFPSGLDAGAVIAMAETSEGPTMTAVARVAKSTGMAICGSFVAREGDTLRNRAFFVEPDGQRTFADKRHLFSMAGEHNVFTAGTGRMSLNYKGWNIAMIVCYDLRFPVWIRNVHNDYDLLISVACWPDVRVDVWNKLLYARAIENEAFVCGVDCAGIDHQGFNYDGSSLAIDFKGKNVGLPDAELGIIRATFSQERLRKFREKFPAWRDADAFRLE